MNRAERRKIARKDLDKKIELYDAVTQNLSQLTQNDISVKAYQKGYSEGMADAAQPIIKRYYSATMMALHRLYGFGQERCIRTLRCIEECLIDNFNDMELVNRVEKELGIEIDMEEGINRAQPGEKGKPC